MRCLYASVAGVLVKDLCKLVLYARQPDFKLVKGLHVACGVSILGALG